MLVTMSVYLMSLRAGFTPTIRFHQDWYSGASWRAAYLSREFTRDAGNLGERRGVALAAAPRKRTLGGSATGWKRGDPTVEGKIVIEGVKEDVVISQGHN